MERLGLEVPAGFADAHFVYNDEASHSDGDGESDDDDDDDGNARVIKNPRLVHCGDDYEMGAPPAAGAAVAVVCRWLASSDAPCKPSPAGAGASRFVAAHHCKQLAVPQVLEQQLPVPSPLVLSLLLRVMASIRTARRSCPCALAQRSSCCCCSVQLPVPPARAARPPDPTRRPLRPL